MAVEYPQIPDPELIFASSIEDVYISIEPFNNLVTTAEIRAVFGLSEVELPDSMLTQRVYTRELKKSFFTLEPRLKTEWVSLVSQNPALQDLVETYALYFIATKICDSLHLIVARTLTDSKATFQRFDSDLQSIIDNMYNRFALAKVELAAAIPEAVTTSTIRVPTLFGSGTPDYDPITGETT